MFCGIAEGKYMTIYSVCITCALSMKRSMEFLRDILLNADVSASCSH